MKRERSLLTAAICFGLAVVAVAQRVPAVPRPPAPPPGPPPAEDGSAAPDGYAPIPEWPGQTRAPRPSQTAAFIVETVAEGLPARSVSAFFRTAASLSASAPAASASSGRMARSPTPSRAFRSTCGRAGRGCSRSEPTARSRRIARSISPTPCCPMAPIRPALPRSPGVLVAARARLSADDRRLEDRQSAARTPKAPAAV